MSTIEGKTPERRPAVFLTADEAVLLKLLAEEEKCSASTIHELTGIPVTSISQICKSHNIKLSGKSGMTRGKAGSAHKIRLARKVAIIKAKHAEALGGIRKKYEGT